MALARLEFGESRRDEGLARPAPDLLDVAWLEAVQVTEGDERLLPEHHSKSDLQAPPRRSPEGLTFRGAAGDSVLVPRGAAHTYRNVGAENDRLLVFFRDNERMPLFFEELGELLKDPGSWATSAKPLDIARVLEICARHGVELAGPPPREPASD